MRIVAAALEIAGLAVLVYGMWLLAPWAGFVVGGLVAAAFAFALGFLEGHK